MRVRRRRTRQSATCGVRPKRPPAGAPRRHRGADAPALHAEVGPDRRAGRWRGRPAERGGARARRCRARAQHAAGAAGDVPHTAGRRAPPAADHRATVAARRRTPPAHDVPPGAGPHDRRSGLRHADHAARAPYADAQNTRLRNSCAAARPRSITAFSCRAARIRARRTVGNAPAALRRRPSFRIIVQGIFAATGPMHRAIAPIDAFLLNREYNM